MNNYVIYNGELYHYGVKGMKWGVRRYRNADGTLTSKGKKRISKQYAKSSKGAMRDLQKNYQSMYVKSYNRAADEMNRGGIDKFNAAQRKKYGDKYADRDGYMSDYQKHFDKAFAKNWNKTLNEFYSTNKNVQKSKKLIDKYGMTKWDDLARDNEAKIEEVRRAVEKGV